jgi:hypothetical protein
MKFKVHKKLGTQNSSSQIAEKRMDPKISKPQIATFTERPRIKFANLQFVELICGPPNFDALASPPISSLMNIYPLTYRHKVLTYVEYRAVSRVFKNIDPHPPLHPASVSSPRTKGGGYTSQSPGGDGGGGQYFGRRET